MPTAAGRPPELAGQFATPEPGSRGVTHVVWLLPADDTSRNNGAKNPNGGIKVPTSLSALVNRDEVHSRTTPTIHPTTGIRKLPAEMSSTAVISRPRPRGRGGIGGTGYAAPASWAIACGSPTRWRTAVTAP